MTGLIDNLPKKLLLRRYKASYGGSIAVGSTKRMLPSAVGYTIPEGYYPVGVTYFTTGSAHLSLDYLQLYANSNQSSSYWISVKNTGTSASGSSSYALVDVLFAPSWMVELTAEDIPQTPQSDIIKEPVFRLKSFTCAYTSLASGSAKAFTQANMGFFIPDGYEIFSFRNISSGNMNVTISDCDPFNSSRMVTIRNTHSSAISGTVGLGVMFINKKYVEYGIRRNLSITAQEGITVNCSESNGPVLIGNTVTVTVDNPQASLYIMRAEGLSVSSVNLSSDNSYSHQFTMPDSNVSISICACYLLTTNVTPSTTMNLGHVNPNEGTNGSTPSGFIYYCEANKTITYYVLKDTYGYSLQSANINGTDLVVNENDDREWVEFVMPTANRTLNITLIPTT